LLLLLLLCLLVLICLDDPNLHVTECVAARPRARRSCSFYYTQSLSTKGRTIRIDYTSLGFLTFFFGWVPPTGQVESQTKEFPFSVFFFSGCASVARVIRPQTTRNSNNGTRHTHILYTLFSNTHSVCFL
jgi:hypothetical protein